MPVELFEKLILDLKSLNYRGRISFHFYNEPLLCDNLSVFLVFVKQHLPACRTDLYTNGVLLTRPVLDSLLELGVDKFIVTKHANVGAYPFEAMYHSLPNDIRRHIHFQDHSQLQFTNRGGLVPGSGSRSVESLRKVPCFIPSALLVVTAEGYVLPCFEDFHEQNRMGNIREKTLLEIWQTKEYVEFRTTLKNRGRELLPVCQSCNCGYLIPP